MRHPKNPFSSGEPADDAFERSRDRDEPAAEAAPGRGSGTPPPLPHRTGDSGFRPHGRQAAGPQDFWPLTDPEDSWPLAPRPNAATAGSWSPPGPEDSWQAPVPAQADPRDEWAQGGPRDESAQGDPQDYWEAPAPEQGAPSDDWSRAGGRESWPPPAPARAPAQGGPRDEWAHAGPEEAWEDSGPAQGRPPGSWGRAGARDSWSPDSRPQAAPRDPWLPPPAREGPTGRDDLPPGGHDFFPAPPRVTDRAHEDDRPQHDERRYEDEPRWEDERPRQERVPAAPAGQTPDQEADPAPAPMGFQDLWESWEPPYDPIGAISEPVLHPTAPYPELVRDAEYEDELGLWETPAPGGPGGSEPPGHGAYGGEPYYPGPRRRAQHARNAGRPRMSGAFLALAGALAIAGAIPLGILGVRTLGHHGNSAPKTAPLSANHAAASPRGPNGAPTFTALAGPGCPAAAGATAFPYHAPNGDGWHAGTGAGTGPCGSSFTFSYLAMVPGNPGEWHDHYAWLFRTGMDNPSCRFSFYIPAAPQANSTDYYWFSAGDSNAVNRIADFTIDQAAHQGQWVTKGPFTFPGGTVLIEATDRGEGAPTASVAVGPVRLSC
jgi:hypothetical protein